MEVPDEEEKEDVSAWCVGETTNPPDKSVHEQKCGMKAGKWPFKKEERSRRRSQRHGRFKTGRPQGKWWGLIEEVFLGKRSVSTSTRFPCFVATLNVVSARR